MSSKVTIDRIPLIAYAAVLLGSWGAASYFSETTIMVRPSPELPVWAAYDNTKIATLLAYALGGLLLAAIVPAGRAPDGRQLAREVQLSAVKLSRLWWLLAALSLVGSIYVKGPFLLRAPVYLSFTAAPALVSLFGSLQPLGVLAAGVVSVRSRLLGWSLAGAWFFVMFSYATRTFAAVLVLFMIGRWLGGSRVSLYAWLGSALSVLLLLPIPLMCRGYPAHGFSPYWWGLTQEVKDPQFLATAAHTISSNLGFGIPLLVKTSQQTSISWSDMIISINPAPTRLAGWDKIMSSMRVHDFIPYSAMGEWARFGGMALLGFTFVWGLVVRLSLLSIARSSSILKVPFIAAVLGIAMISMVLTLQYNTRAVARMLDLIVALAIMELITRHALDWWDSRISRSYDNGNQTME